MTEKIHQPKHKPTKTQSTSHKPKKITLFDYQTKSLNAVKEMFQSHPAVMLEMGKGEGKTFTAAKFILDTLWEHWNSGFKAYLDTVTPPNNFNNPNPPSGVTHAPEKFSVVVPANKTQDWFDEIIKFLFLSDYGTVLGFSENLLLPPINNTINSGGWESFKSKIKDIYTKLTSEVNDLIVSVKRCQPNIAAVKRSTPPDEMFTPNSGGSLELDNSGENSDSSKSNIELQVMNILEKIYQKLLSGVKITQLQTREDTNSIPTKSGDTAKTKTSNLAATLSNLTLTENYQELLVGGGVGFTITGKQLITLAVKQLLNLTIYTKGFLIIGGVKLINLVKSTKDYDENFLINVVSNEIFNRLEPKTKKSARVDSKLYRDYIVLDEAQKASGASNFSKKLVVDVRRKLLLTGGVLKNHLTSLFKPLVYLKLVVPNYQQFLKQYFNTIETKLFLKNKVIYTLNTEYPIDLFSEKMLLALYDTRVVRSSKFKGGDVGDFRVSGDLSDSGLGEQPPKHHSYLNEVDGIVMNSTFLEFDDPVVDKIMEDLKSGIDIKPQQIYLEIGKEFKLVNSEQVAKINSEVDFDKIKSLTELKKIYTLKVLKKPVLLSHFTLTTTLIKSQLMSGWSYNYGLFDSDVIFMYSRKRIEKLEQFLIGFDENLVVFYNFNFELFLLESVFNKLGWNIRYFNGDKKDSISEFNESCGEVWETNKTVYLMHYKSGSTGIDGLQFKFNNMLFYTLPVSASDFWQAHKRIHRTHQVRDCNFYYLMSSDSHEEKIYKTLIDSAEYQLKINNFKL